MKTIVNAVFVLFISISSCYGQTQSQMNDSSARDLKTAEIKMDSIFKKIQKVYVKDTIFIKNIKASQRYWNNYYSNQINAMFPKYPTGHHYGSMLSMCVTSYAKKIVESRILELEKWLIGREDGDCSSSIKPKEELPAYDPYKLREDF